MNAVKKGSIGGFTLVELMVVVAIIGLLSAVALPNFKKYQAKSKTAEAKLQLAAIFTAQTAFFSDYDVYASCLKAMGYDPSNEVNQRYYAVGIADDFSALAGSSGAAACTAAPGNASQWTAGKTVAGQAVVAAVTAASTDVTATAWTAMAEGRILDVNIDRWSINHNKVIVNVSTGF